MNNKQRIQFIYIPFLICCILLLGIYNLMRWGLDTCFGVFTIAPIFSDYVLPFGLASLLYYFFLRKRVCILEQKDKKEVPVYVIVTLTMFIPALLFQYYLQERSRVLYEVQSIFEVEDVKPFDCFHIEQLVLLKEHTVTSGSSHFYNPRRGTRKFIIDAYVVAPLTDSTLQFNNKKHRYWYGFYRTTSLGTSGSDEYRRQEYTKFQAKTREQFEKHNPYTYTYQSIAGYNHREGYIKAIQSVYEDVDPEEIVILESNNEVFDNTGEGKLKWAFITFVIGALIFLGIVMNAPVD